MKIADFIEQIPNNQLHKNIFISVGDKKYEIDVLNWNSGDLVLEALRPSYKEVRITEIRDKYISTRFPGREKSYIQEWEERFDEGIEWQKSDLQGRYLLQNIAPDIYPEDDHAFFIREFY